MDQSKLSSSMRRVVLTSYVPSLLAAAVGQGARQAATTKRRLSPLPKGNNARRGRNTRKAAPVNPSKVIQLPYGRGFHSHCQMEGAIAAEASQRKLQAATKHSGLPIVELSRDKKGIRLTFNESSLEGHAGPILSPTAEVPIAWLEDNDASNHTPITHQRLRVPTLPVECDRGSGRYAANQYLGANGGVIDAMAWSFGDGTSKAVVGAIPEVQQATPSTSSAPTAKKGRGDFFQDTKLLVRVKSSTPSAVPSPAAPVTADQSATTSSTESTPTTSSATAAAAVAATTPTFVTYRVPLVVFRSLNPVVGRLEVGVAQSDGWLSSASYPQLPLPKLWSSSDKDFAGPGVRPLEAKYVEGQVLPKEVVTTNYFGSTNQGDAAAPASAAKRAVVAQSRRKALHSIEKYGFTLVTDKSLAVSHKKSYTDSSRVGYEEEIHMRAQNHERMLFSMFGVLKSTHYGTYSTWRANVVTHAATSGTATSSPGVAKARDSGKKVESDDTHLDGAWDNCWLDLHTDNSYFADSPRLQGFGNLYTTPQTKGGYTTLVDGFKIAAILQRDHPWAFKLLSEVPITGQYVKEGQVFLAHRPAFSIDPELKHFHSQQRQRRDASSSVTNSGVLLPPAGLKQVTFNNSDRMPFRLSPQVPTRSALEKFYQAYALLHRTIHDPMHYTKFLLKPGSLMVFDNHRLLHGRTDFTGPRVMGGAYIGSDDYRSSTLSALTPTVDEQVLADSRGGLISEGFSWADVAGGESKAKTRAASRGSKRTPPRRKTVIRKRK